MLAKRIVGLLPDLSDEAALEVSLIHSAVGFGLPSGRLIRRPPFRAPHHGSSAVSLVGGGSASLRPGEASLSHRGVLFLDELGEFGPHCLEMLREPLEEGLIRVARAAASATFPARFLLVAAMNPCPCGEAGRPGSCRCTDRERLRYGRRLSGPLLDRFDLRILVERPAPEAVVAGDPGESTSQVGDRVAAARSRAAARGVVSNSRVPDDAMDEVAPLTGDAVCLLQGGLATGGISARGVQRVRRVALTLADLAGQDPPDRCRPDQRRVGAPRRTDSSARGGWPVSTAVEGARGSNTPQDKAYIAALACLPGMGPSRLAAMLTEGGVGEVWDRLRHAGEVNESTRRVVGVNAHIVETWANVARSLDVTELWRRHSDLGVEVLMSHDAGWPLDSEADPDPPIIPLRFRAAGGSTDPRCRNRGNKKVYPVRPGGSG